MIIFDTETTGFIKAQSVPLAKQPQIIEFAAIKVDWETLEEIGRIEFLANPGKKLSDEIVKITGITDDMLKDENPFSANYGLLVKFFLGESTMAAHNCSFDRDMLKMELERMGRLTQFPWPARHICTVEKSRNIAGKKLKLSVLHEMATGKSFEGAHRAMADAEALYRCVKWLREKGLM